MHHDGPTRDEPEDGTSVLGEDDLEAASDATRAGLPERQYASLDPRALLLGRAFGGFRIVRELASGGMASVFLARKDGPGRVSQHAAIKVVHPHLACQGGFVDMFLDEARIVSCVSHPNVCRVLDFGQQDETYYLAMEYVLGETWSAFQAALANNEAGRSVLPAVAAYVIAQACEGLHAAHEASDDQGQPLQIVHRDVSPQNVFVAYDGTVRVLDFGIARAADRITTTQAGTVKGRLAYMAPEQMEGVTVDRRADIWSLGVVLREALENKRLFRRNSDAETMMAVTSDDLPPWSVPIAPRLAEIVARALERDPERRYATARQLGLDLMRFTRGQAASIDMPELSAWMHRLFPQKLEEKRMMLQEQAPAPRSGTTPLSGTSSNSPSATPSAAPQGPLRSGEYSSSTQELLMQPSHSRWGRAALIGIVLGGAGAGVWFARRGLHHEFAETQLSASVDEAPAPGAAGQPDESVAPSAPKTVGAPGPEAEPRAAVAAEPLPPAASAEPAEPLEPEAAAVQPTAPTQADTREPATSVRDDERRERRRRREERRAERELAAPTGERSSPRAGPPPAPAAGAPGTLAIAYAGGWAEVYLGEKRLGTTPGRFTLPSGRQTIIVKPFGTGTPLKRVIDVAPDRITKLVIQPNSAE